MKKMVRLLLAVWLLVPMTGFSQTYQTLWKQVEEAQDKDLPKTAIAQLEIIEKKADKERAYGQLLKSALLHSRLQAEVAPDSLRDAVERLEQQEKTAQDVALKAVYAAVLSKVYAANHQLGDDWEVRKNDYRQQALARPDALAQVKSDDYSPFVVNGQDSECYGNDLLSVVGAELGAWDVLHAYYEQAGNRRASCLTALKQLKSAGGRHYEPLAGSAYIRQLDSLMAVFGDLPEVGELAIERYEYMSAHTDATAAQKYEWLQQSLSRWGTWKRANVLRNGLLELTNPNFSAIMEHKVIEVNRSQTVELRDLRHLQGLTMRLYQTKLTGETTLNPEDDNDFRKIKSGMTELKDRSRSLTFTGHQEYEVFEDSVLLEGLPAGVYLVEFSSNPQTRVSRALYFVSGIRTMIEAQPDQQIRYVVVDATTGQPVSGASVQLSFNAGWNEPKETKTLTCNKQGEALYQGERQPSEVFAFTAADKFCPSLNGYGRYFFFEHSYNTEHTNLFTDRSIYRPGQTVHVTAIVWKELSALDNQAVADKTVKMELHDANYKLLSEQQVKTDRFGKCSATFTLPKGLLNGRFTIRANNGSASIRVEEYKRPTFQIEFPEYKEAYQSGDTVRLQGKAMTYAGVPVQSAKVHFKVVRQVAFWWMSYARYWQTAYFGRNLQSEVMNEGDAITADDGTFIVDMPMVLPEDKGRRPMFYHFVAEVDVTDMAGETHHGTMSLPLGSKPTALTCDIPQQVRRDQLPPVTISRRNAAGKEIEGAVTYRIDNGKWQQCTANAPFSIPSSVKSGEHNLVAVCEQDTLDVKFVVFGLDDKKPALTTSDWYYVSHDQFPADGSPVTLQVGSSDPDLHIVYGIYADNKLIESGAEKKNAALINRQFTYREEYGNGLLLTYAWVKNGQCHVHQSFIRRPLPDKKLKMAWETFRDRLTPGQQEEWRMTIRHADGTPADASLMAVLYDKSLDAIHAHRWSFAPENNLPKPTTAWLWTAWGNLVGSGAASYRMLDVPSLEFSRFDDSVYPYYVKAHPSMVYGAVMVKGATRANKVMEKAQVFDAVETSVGALRVEAAEEKASADAAPEPEQEVTVRENLNETAFCYPAVEADEQGGYVLKFTLPESLTTWRFMGVSNTADMHYGLLEAEAVAKKDVMVQPNMPRFVRMGDDAQLSVRIFNTSGKTVSGTARLQLIHPETSQVVHEQSLPFSVEADKTANVSCHFSPDADYPSLLICKVVATGDGFSDGEQHYLPVLPDCEWITKTVPFTQHEPGVKTIDMAKLFPPLTTHHKLTVEYTNNPAWLMIQSLPVLGQPWEHSAVEQAASYYSNRLAKSLLAQYPQVKNTFEQWQRELPTAHASSLLSQLSRNQELKDLVLAETPWVADADREEEQKQCLADFFDENTINNRLNAAVEKLKKLQNPDGSFSWYPGMQGSTMMTVTVQEMLTRLKVMDGEQKDTRQMQANAFSYIGKEMAEMVAKLKKEEKKGRKPSFPSFTALRWLYVCALDGRKLPGDVKAANDYLIALLKKEVKGQTIYEKALTAVVLSKHGEQKKAQEYVQSLKEYSVFTEEMGRYYDTPRATYSWYDYKIPTEVAAMEAIRLVTPKDVKTVDEMCRWLLQEKRTQAWNTPINTVNAIYAFLASPDSRSALKTVSEPAVLAIDGTSVQTPAATAGLGYVKAAIDAPQGKTFTATKTSEGTSWGAVYAQFMQKGLEVDHLQSGISVKREVMTADGQPLAANSQLAVGSRITVRITIETSRDLDFVQVVDRRAACMEPVRQLSGYANGAYCTPKDFATNYYYHQLSKGKHVIVTDYYIDRAGCYESGTCSVGCAYAPEFRATTPSTTFYVQ